MRFSQWIAVDTQTNALATATRAAPGSAGLRHWISHISASYETSRTGTLILKAGTTELARWEIYDHVELEFPTPIPVTAGDAMNVELDASGAGGVDGQVVVAGFTA